MGLSLEVCGLAFMAAWYYIEILYNHVDAGKIFAFIATYSLWLVFVVTVVFALSAWLPTGGAAGFAILITLIFQILDSFIGKYWTYHRGKFQCMHRIGSRKIPICRIFG